MYSTNLGEQMKTLIKLTLPLATLCLFTSCGRSLNQAGSSSTPSQEEVSNQNETIVSDGSNIKGFYAADLYPINYNLHFRKVGLAGVEREEDRFSAYVKLQYGHKGIEHRQAIYTGRRCPNIKDDLNKDAYIDIREAMVAMGKITIPLDDNIDSQMEGQNQNPIGDINTGKYFYERTASFDRMFSDLKGVDHDPEDLIIKISEEDGLTFPGRIVLIQGANNKKELPKTVATMEGLTPYESIPVACGVLWKVDARPTDLIPE